MLPRHRIRSSCHSARPSPGVSGEWGRGGGEGRQATFQRVTAAVGSDSNRSFSLGPRRISKAMAPEASAASCSRREAVRLR
jgi:hypothetical protein